MRKRAGMVLTLIMGLALVFGGCSQESEHVSSPADDVAPVETLGGELSTYLEELEGLSPETLTDQLAEIAAANAPGNGSKRPPLPSSTLVASIVAHACTAVNTGQYQHDSTFYEDEDGFWGYSLAWMMENSTGSKFLVLGDRRVTEGVNPVLVEPTCGELIKTAERVLAALADPQNMIVYVDPSSREVEDHFYYRFRYLDSDGVERDFMMGRWFVAQ